MPNQSTGESFDPFRAGVRRLIDLENRAGTAHFSFEAQRIQTTTALDLSELDDIDRALLELLTTSLDETILLLDTEPEKLSDDYRLKIHGRLNEIMKQGQKPTQNLFRAYLNNKFAVLVGQIQLFASAQRSNNTKTVGAAAQELREMARVYLPILKSGR